MSKLKKKYFSLLCFNGAGSKLLQAQIGNADDVFTIPAYPLKYFPLFFKEWKKNNEVIPWKRFNSNMAIAVEFDLTY